MPVHYAIYTILVMLLFAKKYVSLLYKRGYDQDRNSYHMKTHLSYFFSNG